jgi:MFS family permease
VLELLTSSAAWLNQVTDVRVKKMSRRTIAVLLACFSTILMAYTIRYSYGTLLPEMLPALAITKAEAGVIYSSYFIAYTLFSPVLGLLSDRYNMRIMIAAFVCLMGIGTFLMQYASSVLQTSICFTVAGIGCAACWAPVMALAQRWTSDKRRGMSLAFIDVGSSLGVVVAGSLVPLVIAGSNWRRGWMFLGIVAIVLGIIDYFLIRNSPEIPGNSVVKKTGGRGKLVGLTYKQLLSDSRFWLIGIAYLLTGFAVIIPFTFISTYAVQELSFSYNSATLLIAIIGAGGIIGKLSLGPFSDKWGRLRIMISSAILIGGGCLAMAYSRGLVLMAVCFVYGIGYGACWSMYAACAADFFSKQAAGGIIGLWTVLLGIGSLTAPILSGWSADVTGTLMWAFLIAAAAGIGSLVLLLPMLKMAQVNLLSK